MRQEKSISMPSLEDLELVRRKERPCKDLVRKISSVTPLGVNTRHVSRIALMRETLLYIRTNAFFTMMSKK